MTIQCNSELVTPRSFAIEGNAMLMFPRPEKSMTFERAMTDRVKVLRGDAGRPAIHQR